jgi:hypothetical protein
MRFTQTDLPLTEQQLEECLEAQDCENVENTEFIVDVALNDLIVCYGIDDINNLCDETIFANVSACLTDINYEVEGKTDKDTVAIKVIAFVEEI